jgi:hypothetical protein
LPPVQWWVPSLGVAVDANDPWCPRHSPPGVGCLWGTVMQKSAFRSHGRIGDPIHALTSHDQPVTTRTKLPSRPRLMAIPSGNGSYHLDKRSLKSPRIYNHRRPRSALGVKDLCTTSVIDASSKSLTLLTRFRDSTRTWRKVSFATDASGRIVDSSHCRNLNPRNPGRTSNADVRPPRNLTMSDRRSDSTGRTIHGHYTQELPPTAWQ